MSVPHPQQPNDEDARRREAEAAMRQRVLQVVLDPQARRLMNIRLVKPELAAAVENYLINAASSGRINRPLTDEELKQLLLRIQQPKKDFKIERR